MRQIQIDELPTRSAFVIARNGDEQDATSKASRRRIKTLVNRPEIASETRRLMRRRDRRAVRQALSTY